MKILNICVGASKEVTFRGKLVRTSIFKAPIEGRVAIRQLNIDGDQQSDLSVHGGRDKAIYVYSNDYHDDWARELFVDSLQASQFSENLTVTGGTDSQVVIGARYRIGDVEVTVTQPRIPCYKLGDPGRVDIVLFDQPQDRCGGHRINTLIGPTHAKTAPNDLTYLGPLVARPVTPIVEPHPKRRHVGR